MLAVATLILGVAALSPLTAGADQTGSRPGNRGLQRDQPSGQSIVATALGAGLIEAVERNNIADLSELLAGGADVNAAVPGDGSALIAAARSNRLSIVTFLVERGADVNLAVEGDGNPLIVASAIGALPIVQYLLDHGADANAVVPGDESPLINASGNGRLDVVRLLVERGANVNLGVWVDAYQQQKNGEPVFEREYRSPLSMAQKAGRRAVVDFLRANGATN